MPAGPTTEGSIVGYLRLDASDWNETLDRAEARARELGRTDPTITVDANIGDAMSKIEAVKAAEASLGGKDISFTGNPAKIDSVAAAQKRLDAAERAAANAASTQYLAELRLEDVQGRRNKSAYALAAAEEAVARATRNAESAEVRHIAASNALTQAKQAVARAALEEAAAQQTEAAATDEATASVGRGVSRYALIAGAIAAIIPVAGALTGYLVGAGGAVLGMASAGVLAIIGIKNAMADGTKEGILYQAGLNSLKGDLDKLSNTAAIGMLRYFWQAVSQINQAMPMLNGQVGVFTNQLGNAGVRALTGVLNALRILNPLFVQAGVYIQQIAAGFLAWTTNGGLQQFADDSIKTFPLVANALGSILSVTMHLIQVLAPLGSIMLLLLTGAADLANVLLNVMQPGLVVVAGAAAAVWGAFRLWDGISPKIIGAGKAAVQFGVDLIAAAGPAGALGIAVVGVTVAIVGWNAVMQAQKAFAQAAALATQDYTAAITADSGAIKENTAAQIAKQLHDSGTIENAHKLGLSTATVTEAVLGHKDAIDKVNAATKAYSNGSKEQDAQLKKTGLSLSDLGTAQEWVRQGVDNTSKSVRDGVEAYRVLNSVQGTVQSNMNENKTLTDRYKDAVDEAAKATDKFAQELAGLGNVNLSASQANIAYQQSLADADAALKNNGATLELNTQKGRDNASALNNIASNAISLIAANAKAGASTGDLTGQMQAARDSFIATATKMGATSDQANQLADKLGLIPGQVPIAFHTSGLDDAIAKVQSLQAWIGGLHDKTVRIVADASQMGTAGKLYANASGGFAGTGAVQYRANGGFSDFWRPQGTDTIPTMLSPGEFTVKEKSASYDPQFLKAYNDNPAAALASVKQNRGGDRPIYMDGALFGVLREMANGEARIVVNLATARQKAGLQSGLQKVAY